MQTEAAPTAVRRSSFRGRLSVPLMNAGPTQTMVVLVDQGRDVTTSKISGICLRLDDWRHGTLRSFPESHAACNLKGPSAAAILSPC